jgi:ubiquinone/menaquinone biosynthesis C-methylase UbiE
MDLQTIEKRILATRPASAASRRMLMPLLSGRATARAADVLHIGCGTGWTTRRLARAFPAWNITALDSDAELIAKAFHRLGDLGERVRVYRADPPELPFPDQSFDLVVAAYVWHRLDDWRTVTLNTHRVMRPGAAFVVTDMLKPSITMRRPSMPQRTPSLIEVKVALTAAGFRLTRCTEFAGIWYRILAHR